MRSATLMDHFRNPRNVGALENPDLVGTAGTPGQGNFMVLHLKMADGRVSEARFRCHGCGPSIACGSMLTTLIVGRKVGECSEIDERILAEALDGMPPGKEHTPGLAIAALRDALSKAKVVG
ncbi:MAG: iron-sulfur cluster assembly scaffold protein [Armatimonadetes bacterium]|nr:iron-sulfur cluster assembly scaffold protein [Armatimonadota bacterium]